MNQRKEAISIRQSAAFSLIGLRTIRWRDMRLFLINIILISFLFTITLSIFLGIGQTEPFVSETENTLILTEPDKEPMFSFVPVYLAEDLYKLEGVIAVSPEMVDICYHADKNQPVIVRGVTDEFLEVLNTYRIRSGRWFNFTTGAMEGIVGKRYADELGVQSGESILLVSRRTDLIVSVTIVGIIESNTNADDSILLPLWLGQLLSDYTRDEVKLMRIRFDPAITSDQIIRETVNGEFRVTIDVKLYNST
ncbi:MAG: ABC transporter permease, partial [Candidatus Thorarchaeota archaeon]